MGLKVILSSDWPVVVTGLVQWVGLWERPGWLSILDTLDRPVRNVAVWGGRKKGEKIKRAWTKRSPDSMIGFYHYITFEGLNCSGNLASTLFRVSSLPTEFLCSVLSSLLLLLMVESAYEPADSKTDSWKHFLCMQHTMNSQHTWSQLLTLDIFLKLTKTIMHQHSSIACSYLRLWLKGGEGAWVVRQSLGSTGKIQTHQPAHLKRAHYSMTWFKPHYKENCIKMSWH